MSNKDLLASLMKPKVEPLKDLSSPGEPTIVVDKAGEIVDSVDEVIVVSETHPEMVKLQDTIDSMLDARNERRLSEIPLGDEYWEIEEAHKNQYRKCKDLNLLG